MRGQSITAVNEKDLQQFTAMSIPRFPASKENQHNTSYFGLHKNSPFTLCRSYQTGRGAQTLSVGNNSYYAN